MSDSILNTEQKICSVCDFPFTQDRNKRGKCSICYNKQRRDKRLETAKKLTEIKIPSISDLYIKNIKMNQEDILSIENHLSEIEKLPENDKQNTILLFLLDNISKTRIKDISSFINIGKLFHSISYGSSFGLETWISYCNDNDVESINCPKLYKSFNDISNRNKITIKTLYYYLKLDNPIFYVTYHELSMKTSIINCLCSIQDSIAKALYEFFHLNFFYCNNTNTWYYFNGNILKKDLRNTYLKSEITHKFIPIFERIYNSINECTEFTEKQKYEQLIPIKLLIKNLQSNSFINHCIDMSHKFFRCEDLNLYLDNNKCIMALENGILEVIPELGIAITRDIIPEDYITKKINVLYDKKMSLEHPDMKLLLTWLHQLFPYEDLYNYVIKLCSAFLLGKNTIKKFIIFTGKSNGGKSSFCKLLERTFGMYLVTLSGSFLDKTSNSNNSGPTPELSQLNGSHVAIISEADSTKQLSSNKIKKFTGNDKTFARKCHSNGEAIDFAYFILCCNNMPSLDEIDSAIILRLLSIPFMSEYKENVEDNYETHIFKRNNNFETEILPNLISTFLWLLFNTYPIFIKEGLGECQTSINHTKKYFEEIDMYLVFKNEKLEKVENNLYISISDIYPLFLCWYNSNYTDSKGKPTKTLCIRELDRVLGDNIKNKWYGYSIIEENK